MRAKTAVLTTALLLGASLTVLPSAAEAGGKIRIDVDSDDGGGVHLALGTGLVSGLVRAFAPIAIDCDGNDDNPRVRELFLALDRAGEPSRGTTTDTDGDRIDARRRHGKLLLTVTDEDGDVSRIEMPWKLARCVLGGESISGAELAHALESASFEVHVEDDDGSVHVAVN